MIYILGIGTIGIFASSSAKKVYGIEIVEAAVENAKENAKLNETTNVEFICGDVEKKLAELIDVKGAKADVVFVDPPRKGMDETSINNLLKIEPKKIVYISCNPATLVRDLAKFEKKYDIEKIIPVDLFPYTSHVECVAVGRLR